MPTPFISVILRSNTTLFSSLSSIVDSKAYWTKNMQHVVNKTNSRFSRFSYWDKSIISFRVTFLLFHFRFRQQTLHHGRVSAIKLSKASTALYCGCCHRVLKLKTREKSENSISIWNWTSCRFESDWQSRKKNFSFIIRVHNSERVRSIWTCAYFAIRLASLTLALLAEPASFFSTPSLSLRSGFVYSTNCWVRDFGLIAGRKMTKWWW